MWENMPSATNRNNDLDIDEVDVGHVAKPEATIKGKVSDKVRQ